MLLFTILLIYDSHVYSTSIHLCHLIITFYHLSLQVFVVYGFRLITGCHISICLQTVIYDATIRRIVISYQLLFTSTLPSFRSKQNLCILIMVSAWEIDMQQILKSGGKSSRKWREIFTKQSVDKFFTSVIYVYNAHH